MKLKRRDRRNGGFPTRREAIACSMDDGLVWQGTNNAPGSKSDRLIKEETTEEEYVAYLAYLDDNLGPLMGLRDVDPRSADVGSCYDDNEPGSCDPTCLQVEETLSEELSN